MPLAMLVPLLVLAAVVARTDPPGSAERAQPRLASQAAIVARAARAATVIGVRWVLHAP